MSKTTGLASTCVTSTSCLASFSGCIEWRTFRVPASAWRWSDESSSATEARSGPRPLSTRARPSISRWGTEMREPEAVEILLVEDNPNDVELTLHALRASHLANDIKVVRDGEEALDFIMCRGPYGDRDIDSGPRVILLDLKLPKVDGIEVLRQVKA